ncbi:hypothetical protein F3Y22_tig00111128pilonHSYRG00082 [Hibiscus syriacus]|uniref:Uncharacterized protein n=1 Tax=Hibiscus syriacus TaxID=106335 RepID=A0A6A2Z015_HIBSY|nr:hypothetical protein F3Y22_tig00111128pilonHSYRG00082 [Hibiscus syriacus]
MQTIIELLEKRYRMYGSVEYAIGSQVVVLDPSGHIVLDYAKAIQESVFEQLHVVRDGQLRVVFSPDLKLGSAAQKCQAATQNATDLSAPELQNNCNLYDLYYCAFSD